MSTRDQHGTQTQAQLEALSAALPRLLEGLCEQGLGAGSPSVEALESLLGGARALLMAMFVAQLARARAQLEDESLAGLRARLEQGDAAQRSEAWPRLRAMLAPLRGLICCLDDGALWAQLEAAGPSEAWLLACTKVFAPADVSRRGSLAALPVESVGELYESMLDYRLEQTPEGLALRAWTATRKGAGSFYTPAGLSGPTLRRTLEPLVHTPEGSLRSPRELLALRICDPAMGGGSFLLAALRELGAQLLASLRLHGPSGHALSLPGAALIEIAKTCLFGVDRDPLAVELGRAALWLELGAPACGPALSCPGLRCGDALLGAWRDRVRDYPLAALERRGLEVEARTRLRSKRREAAALAGVREREPAGDRRERFDAWCALWFWPLDALESLPLPGTLAQLDHRAAGTVEALARKLRLFHWELAFPEVFSRPNPGFDALVTNPPWEIHKPSSKEFFSRDVAGYRGLGKQAALELQRELFARSPDSELRWQAEQDDFRARSHFLRHLAQPRGEARARAPFAHQGPADLNAYKLFVELAHVLARDGGQLGLVVPSGLYTDKGTGPLRELLLRECAWRWLYGFENRRKLFDIDARFKFCVLVAGKGGHSEHVRAAFMRRELDDWSRAEGAIDYPTAWMRELSPESGAVVEICSQRDLEVLRTIHTDSVTLAATSPRGWGIRYARELDMTNDSALFVARDDEAAAGMHRDAHGHWRAADGELYLPLYEGRMIDQFDFAAKGWVSGHGRGAKWRELSWSDKRVEPQYLVRAELYRAHRRGRGGEADSGALKLCFMAVGSATNRRSMIAALVRGVPCGNAVPVLRPQGGVMGSLGLVAVLNSFVYDFALRARLGGLNLNYFVVSETALPPPERVPPALRLACARLCLAHPWYAPVWLELLRLHPELGARPLRWALTRHERLRLRCMIDAAIAVIYGLSRADLGWVLSDCDHEVAVLAQRGFCRGLEPKGFWRVERELAPQLRHSVLTMVAYDALAGMLAEGGEPGAAMERFFDEERGWQLPLRLNLDALGLQRRSAGPRSAQAVEVRPLAGPRWLATQLEQSAEQAWRRCRSDAAAVTPR